MIEEREPTLTDKELAEMLTAFRVASIREHMTEAPMQDLINGWARLGRHVGPLIAALRAERAEVERYADRVDELREQVGRLTRERDEWEANEQEQARAVERLEAELAEARQDAREDYERAEQAEAALVVTRGELARVRAGAEQLAQLRADAEPPALRIASWKVDL